MEVDPRGDLGANEHGQPRILLVSDNVSGARLLREVLEELLEGQADVIWVATWMEALSTLERSAADLVVVHLSGTGAVGLTAPLPDVAILVVTGLTEDQVAVRVLQRSSNDALLRPTFGADLVIRSLRLAIERRRIAGGPSQDAPSIRIVPVPEHLRLSEGSVYAMDEGDP